MKASHAMTALLAMLVVLPCAHGQAQAPTTDHGKQQTEMKNKKGHEAASISEAPAAVPLKILVVISEFTGSKKIMSLPYTLYTVAEAPTAPHTGTRQSMRYQLRIPILSGAYPAISASKVNPQVSYQFQFQDVGTDIDYGAYSVGDDSYELVFTVDRSWASMPGPASQQTALERGSILTGQPIIPHFRNSFVVVLKNGQTVEGASATDPVSGHVLKVDVTLTVLK